MDDLKELKSKVEKLDKAENKEERVKILQDIAKSIINEYVIEVGNFTIQPLLIEAYYFDEIKFHDISVHAANESDAKTYKLARERQKNHIGELYVHFSTKDGIDVVLSDGEYYLSFLIKNALIKGEFATQCKISEKLCENCENCDTCNKGYNCIFYNNKVLHKKATAESGKIVYLPRPWAAVSSRNLLPAQFFACFSVEQKDGGEDGSHTQQLIEGHLLPEEEDAQQGGH